MLSILNTARTADGGVEIGPRRTTVPSGTVMFRVRELSYRIEVFRPQESSIGATILKRTQKKSSLVAVRLTPRKSFSGRGVFGFCGARTGTPATNPVPRLSARGARVDATNPKSVVVFSIEPWAWVRAAKSLQQSDLYLHEMDSWYLLRFHLSMSVFFLWVRRLTGFVCRSSLLSADACSGLTETMPSGTRLSRALGLDGIAKHADSRNFYFNGIARGQGPNALRCPGQHEISWFQTHDVRDVGEYERDVKHHVTSVTVLTRQ